MRFQAWHSDVSQLGDTTLPPDVPEMLDDEFLQQLHHTMLEVGRRSFPQHSPAKIVVPDSCRRGCYGVPQLPTRVPYIEWDSQHGERDLFFFFSFDATSAGFWISSLRNM